MDAVNDTPLPAKVVVTAITPGPNVGFIHANILYWRVLVGAQTKNISMLDGAEPPDSYFASDLVDRKNLTGIHYATPPA